jgi:hypothetical protein
MLLGIVTDIHDAVEYLRTALDLFEREGVDQVVSLGDAVETYESGSAGVEIFRLLRDAGAMGVWGNHDAGLSLLWSERIKTRIDSQVKRFAATLKPYLVMEGCRFSHIEPWLDAGQLTDLWYFDGPPDTVMKARRSFDAVSERNLFIGHFHKWLAMTPEGPLAWDGEVPLSLSKGHRHLIVVAHLMHGWCATFDTESGLLTPHLCSN